MVKRSIRILFKHNQPERESNYDDFLKLSDCCATEKSQPPVSQFSVFLTILHPEKANENSENRDRRILFSYMHFVHFFAHSKVENCIKSGIERRIMMLAMFRFGNFWVFARNSHNDDVDDDDDGTKIFCNCNFEREQNARIFSASINCRFALSSI